MAESLSRWGKCLHHIGRHTVDFCRCQPVMLPKIFLVCTDDLPWWKGETRKKKTTSFKRVMSYVVHHADVEGISSEAYASQLQDKAIAAKEARAKDDLPAKRKVSKSWHPSSTISKAIKLRLVMCAWSETTNKVQARQASIKLVLQKPFICLLTIWLLHLEDVMEVASATVIAHLQSHVV